MTSAAAVDVVLRDVTLRDGLQDEDPIPTTDKLAIFEALVAAGLRELELTSFVRADRVPAMADAEALCAALGCVTFVGFAAVAAAQRPADRPAERPVDAARDKPDFTGVWTNYTEPGQAGGRGGGRGAGLPFTEEVRKKISRRERHRAERGRSQKHFPER